MDYYSNPKNDGNIGISLHNFDNSITAKWKKGEGMVQVVFELFLESDNCNSNKNREGGIGSTNKKGE
jgi:dUTP pyrophosphatase